MLPVTLSEVELARHAYSFSRGDPARAIREAEALLAEDPGADAEIIALSAIGLANRMVYAADVAIEYLERAADLALAIGNDQLLGETLRSLAFDYAGAGDIPKALETVTRASSLLTGEELMKADLQHAFILGQAARYSEAIAMLDGVCDTFDITEASLLELIHGNRGSMYLALGRLDAAIEDLETVYATATTHGHPATAADAALHLARAHADLGKMPAAMQWQGVAGELYDTHVPNHLVGHMERADVLIAAGLHREAIEVLELAIPRLEAHAGNDIVLRYGYLQLIDVYMRSGRREEALRVVEAVGTLSPHSRYGPDLLLAGARVRLANGIADEETFATLAATSETKVAEEGVDAMHVRLAAVPLAVRTGFTDIARQLAAGVPADSKGLELALLRSIADAALADSSDDALFHLEAAAGVLDTYRASLGATELRLLAANQGREIARLAIDIAFDSADPWLLFRWLEWIRAGSLALERMAHTQTIDAARVALRKVAAEVAKDPDNPDLATELEVRETELATATRTSTGVEYMTSVTLDLGTVIDALEDRTLVMFVDHAADLMALVVGSTGVRIVKVGDVSTVDDELRQLAGALRRIARGVGSTRGVAAACDLARHHADHLRATLIDPVGDVQRLLVVPSPSTEGVPWSLVSPVAVEVVPAVQTWMRDPASPGNGSVVVTGPRLHHAEGEVEAVAETLGGLVVRTGDELLSALGTVRVAHIAAHATPRFDNPMFSSLELEDGPVRIYDVESVGTAPLLVVLAACDAAVSASRPGADVMSLGVAFLGMGTTNVIAPLLVVSDAMTAVVVGRLYEAMSRGLDSAQALADVVATASSDAERFTAGSFVSLGRAVALSPD